VVRYYHMELYLKIIFDSYFSYGHKAQARAKNYKTKNDDNQYRVFHFYCDYCFIDNNANFSAVIMSNNN
jgi:GH18 family chitinase